MNRLTAEQELFYDDFIRSNVFSGDQLGSLIERAQNQPVSLGKKHITEVLGSEDVPVASIKVDMDVVPPSAVIHFAGIKIEKTVQQLMQDLQGNLS